VRRSVASTGTCRSRNEPYRDSEERLDSRRKRRHSDIERSWHRSRRLDRREYVSMATQRSICEIISVPIVYIPFLERRETISRLIISRDDGNVIFLRSHRLIIIAGVGAGCESKSGSQTRGSRRVLVQIAAYRAASRAA